MEADLTPTPGWIAYTLGRLGHELVMSLMCAAQLALHNQIREQFPEMRFPDLVRLKPGHENPFFTVLANADDPGWDLWEFWRIVGEHFPYLAGVTGPLVNWLDDAPPHRLAKIREAAATLARVDVAGISEQCPAGVLIEVHNELIAIAERLQVPVEHTPLDDTLRHALVTQFGAAGAAMQPGDACGDLACGGGNRLIAAAMSFALAGKDPAAFTYYGADFDPMALAIAGVNCACMGLVDVRLSLHPTPESWKGQIKLLLMNLGEMIDRELGPAIREAFPEISRRADLLDQVAAAAAVDGYTEDFLIAHRMIEAYGDPIPEDDRFLLVSPPKIDAEQRARQQRYLGKHAVTKITPGECHCPGECRLHGGLRQAY